MIDRYICQCGNSFANVLIAALHAHFVHHWPVFGPGNGTWPLSGRTRK